MNRFPTVTLRVRLPRTFLCQNGLPVELRRLSENAGQRLIDMYLAFQPRNSFQGLPPIKDDVCVRWVRDMIATGVHVVATVSPNANLSLARRNPGETLPPAQESPFIGHAAIFPVSDKKCEMLVVVCPGFQNLGVGTELVQSCIALADELGFERIWLPVEATNVRARHVYRKCGFEYASSDQGRELDMCCDVQSRRPKTIFDLHGPGLRVPAPNFHFPSIAVGENRIPTP
jgi:diamine N-acetyltransferase